jgi:hypothetical protein
VGSVNPSSKLLNPTNEEFTFRVEILDPDTLEVIFTVAELDTEDFYFVPVYRNEAEELQLLEKRVREERRVQQGDILQLRYNNADGNLKNADGTI